MGLRRKIFNGVNYFRGHTMPRYYKLKQINSPEFKKLWSAVELTQEQRDEIDEYYIAHYGKKVPYMWHRMYYLFSGKLDKKYFPEHLFIPEYEWISNSENYYYCLGDKNITPLIASGIDGLTVPRVYLSCANGLYRDGEMKCISQRQAEGLLFNIGRAFIKPTVGSSSGRGCMVVSMSGGFDELSGKSAEELLTLYGANFTVQECIEMGESVKRLHPQSVNTFRVITYRTPGAENIHCADTILRIGMGERHTDNAHAGGIYVGVNRDGSLKDKAFNDAHDVFTEHPDTHVRFAGYSIPEIRAVEEKALALHARIPQLGVVNWDMTVNSNGGVVLVEANTRSGSIDMAQSTFGRGIFGDDTDAILEYLRDMRKLCPFNYR